MSNLSLKYLQSEAEYLSGFVKAWPTWTKTQKDNFKEQTATKFVKDRGLEKDTFARAFLAQVRL